MSKHPPPEPPGEPVQLLSFERGREWARDVSPSNPHRHARPPMVGSGFEFHREAPSGQMEHQEQKCGEKNVKARVGFTAATFNVPTLKDAEEGYCGKKAAKKREAAAARAARHRAQLRQLGWLFVGVQESRAPKRRK
eukprot:6389514-Pyramimonas_sp.AAC.1